MKPLAPVVVGPISVCNTGIEVRGNIAGATIEILAGGQTIGSHVSTTPDSVYAITSTLTAGQTVTARQISGGQPSQESGPVTVQAAPTQLSALTIKTVPHVCGRAIRVTGAVPGAKIDVMLAGQQVGAAKAERGWTGVEYDAGNSAQPLTVTQLTCNNLTASQSVPTPVPFPNPLPAPKIQIPLFECQTRITIGDVADGAYVEFYRNNEAQPEGRFVFGVPEEFRWIKPLVKNDVIKVRQGFSCKQPAPPLEPASPFTSATVQPVSALHAPKFLHTPCPGITVVTLGHLVPGARVVLTQNGVELGETDASDVTCNFPVPPLAAGATIEAHMEMCNGKGPSATIQVGPLISPPGIMVSPPYACASLVEVIVNGTAGEEYLAFISNHAGAQISPFYNIAMPMTMVPVFPSLVAGDTVTVNVLTCGGTFAKSSPVTVLSNPAQPVIEQPLWAGYNTVEVVAAAGFVVYVYVNNVVRGSAIAEGTIKTKVTLAVTLQANDQVSCAMVMCGVLQKQTTPVVAVPEPPQRPVLIDPPNGADAVLLQPLLKWQDPAGGTPGAATSFNLTVTQGNATIVSQMVAGTSLTCPVPLMYATVYNWTVTATNSGGQASAASPFGFTTENPPAPVMRFNGQMTTSLPGNKYASGQWFNVFVNVFNSGNAASGPYQIVFTATINSTGAGIGTPVTDQEAPLAAGVLHQDGAQFFIDATETQVVRITADLIVNGQKLDEVWLTGQPGA